MLTLYVLARMVVALIKLAWVVSVLVVIAAIGTLIILADLAATVWMLLTALRRDWAAHHPRRVSAR